MKIREYLLDESKDRVKAIRDILKKKFNLSNRDVGVTYKGSIRVTLKTVKSLPFKNKIEEEVRKYESFQTDQATGAILRGGNTFVFVELDWQFRAALVKKIEAELSKKIPDDMEESTTITVYNDYKIFKNKTEFQLITKKQNSVSGFRSINHLAEGILGKMIRFEDIKNLKKL